MTNAAADEAGAHPLVSYLIDHDERQTTTRNALVDRGEEGARRGRYIVKDED